MKFPLILATLLYFCVASVSFAAPVEQKNPLFPLKSFVSASQTVEAGGSVGLYLLTFTLSATGEDVFLPGSVARSTEGAIIGNPGVLYDIHESDRGLHRGGVSGGFLYSEAERTNGYYIVPRGQSREFTLVVAYQNKGVQEDEYRVRIDALRYALRATDRAIVNETNGFESFKTKEVSLTK